MEKDEPLLYKLLNMTDALDIKTMSGSTAKKAHAIAQLLIYKVIDVASWLNKRQNMQAFMPLPRKPIQHLNVQHFDNMKNYLTVVDNAASLITSIQPRSGTPPDEDTTPTLLLSHIATNVTMAVIHLQYLIEVGGMNLNNDFYRSDVIYTYGNLDLPPTLDAMSSEVKVSMEELKKLGPNMQALRFPLHVALSLSPIVLLLDVSLQKIEHDRPALVAIWQSMGNEHPEVVLAIECVLWHAIFDLARSNIEPIEHLKTAFNEMGPLLNGMVPPKDLLWFTNEGSPPVPALFV
ncbi:hypothetical protein L208DRAFT_1382533 [Tricholoma matsutake]|nr:hypothetical protein L208DRAFT_1382533 [Tricholoma matsutake 945]